jgi:hypothetical protein
VHGASVSVNAQTHSLQKERTKALSYSTMNLREWFEAAQFAQQVDVDLWNYKTSKELIFKKLETGL